MVIEIKLIIIASYQHQHKKTLHAYGTDFTFSIDKGIPLNFFVPNIT